MYERFTFHARRAVLLANQAARQFNHAYIDTEHILLGLIEEEGGTGADILKNVGVDRRKVRQEVERFIQRGTETAPLAKLPQTPGTKMVINYAVEEANTLDHNHVGTEHILLGLLREDAGVAAVVLMNLGVKLEVVRAEVRGIVREAQVVETPWGPVEGKVCSFWRRRAAF